MALCCFVAPLLFGTATLVTGCGSEAFADPKGSGGGRSSGSGGEANETGGTNGSGGRSSTGTGGSKSTSSSKCDEIILLGDARAAAKGCEPESDVTTCDAIYAADRCVDQWEAFLNCVLRQPAAVWVCDVDGEIGIGSACSAELADFQSFSRGAGRGCL